MKKEKKHKLLLIISLLIISSCRDKDPTKPGYQRKPPAPVYLKYRLGSAKEYMWFNPGSYWIYKNTKTNALDTVTCKNLYYDSFVVKGIEDYSKHITVDFDRLITNYYSTYNKLSFEDNTSFFNPNSTPIRDYFYPINRSTNEGREISPFYYPFDESRLSGNGFSQTKFKTLIPNLNINSFNFNNVGIFETDFDAIWYPKDSINSIQYPKSKHYWAQNIGLIKRENISENYSWELIDYNII